MLSGVILESACYLTYTQSHFDLLKIYVNSKGIKL
jgi:hypothetical protein